MSEASPKIQKYFEEIDKEARTAYAVAEKARQLGFDPETKVDVPLAANMAERVAGLISIVAPQLRSNELINRIKELETTYELLDWRVGLKIAEEVAKEKFCSFKNKEEAMEVGIRVGFAYLTLGIVAAPLEGFIGLKIKKRMDGKEYMAAYYAGPIRGAGGTAAATSVILADYIRTVMGLDKYDPTEEEVNRYVTEITDYHERITNLQYKPSEDEIKFLVSHIPIEINGDPSEEIEVSNYKGLQRVETNRIRGGICLVIAEGVAQKSPKIWKRLGKWGADFGLDWGFLAEFLELQKKVKARVQEKVETAKLTPNYTFISDLVAGRPVLSHPMSDGGFRLRYGRTAVSGFSAIGLHPNTLALFNHYIAIGTQLKIERPGKAASVTPCDTIEGPIVKLKDSSVIRLNDSKNIKQVILEVVEVLYLGDILISYGDFSENGHKLVPAGYCEEWWIQEVENVSNDATKLCELTGINSELFSALLADCFRTKISFQDALTISEKLKVPLHPYYSFLWNSISLGDLKLLVKWFESARIDYKDNQIVKIILPILNAEGIAKRALELIGLPHIAVNNEFVVISGDDAQCIFYCLKNSNIFNGSNALEAINTSLSICIKDKRGTFIGARMGRPEKAKMRKMTGSPHILFPVGDEGERLRSFQSALKHGKIVGDFALYYCKNCAQKSIYQTCEICLNKADKLYFCRECGENEQPVCKHGGKDGFRRQEIEITKLFNNALHKLGLTTYPDLIKGVRGTSNKNHVVEHLAKGILRAKHNIYVNKDGTTRYDMTELPVTHFRPREIGTPVEKLVALGYTHDVFGILLKNDDQIVELFPQDVILPSNESLDESSKKVLFRVSKFIDDLLEKFYRLEPYYKLQSEDDLVGHLVVGLAPHISAGLVGRIIGFSDTQGCLAHALWHAGLRRDCDGDEACVMLLLDTLLNFSRQYLPDQRGAKTMDSPLVLTLKLIPSEVDDQSHGLDVVWRYPLELYKAALEYKNPWEVKVDQIKHRLGTEKQYEQFGFTHPVSNINMGVRCSAYKTIPSMEEKLKGQIELATKIRAVDAQDVARLIIEKHFIKDIKGNLRRFSMQEFRCAHCNEKFRRPPLLGKCIKCGGKLLFTVSEGSIIKYLQPSLKLAYQFGLSGYLTQTLELTKKRVESVFGRDKDAQSGLGKWVS